MNNFIYLQVANLSYIKRDKYINYFYKFLYDNQNNF